MATDRGNRKEKNQNIQVFVRLRPINQRERDIKSLGVVEVVNNKEVVVRQSAQTSLTKKFTFDRAFGPNAKQVEVYQEVVSPLIEEVLAGYNCTVFAYGQTGTGKTHTMVGEYTDDQTSWQSDPLAGIIPRVLSQLFDELRLSNAEFTVRVSYLELYNEELFDLLSSSEDNSKLRIYEDVTRKGANIVNGLEEITVYNKKEVYKIMAQGQDRKRMASTLMNAQSSRSHTVFTIVVHMKENSPEGEELVKIGKLNLVDLAGSENISKAGSEGKKERARECVNINQSLLTLGRVITALVERHPHIPYRESKLTRILQESLGGRTKTSIIATVSPGHKDLEETMSTLEYAHRAKNIQNKPEVNQKMTKKAILKEFAEEIDRLKRDLQASRDKNGVYLANETYQEITFKAEEQNKEIQNLILQKRAMEDERDKKESVFKELNETIKEKEYKLETTKTVLEDTRNKLCKTKNALECTTHQYEEQKYLVSKQVETENVLSQQASTLLQTVDIATNHVSDLHNSVDKRRQVENKNVEVTRSLREHSGRMCEDVSTRAVRHAAAIEKRVEALWGLEENYNKSTVYCQKENIQGIDELVQLNTDAMDQIKLQSKQCEEQLTSKTMSSKQCIEKELGDNEVLLQKLMQTFVTGLVDSVRNAKDIDVKGRQMMDSFVQQWYKGASSRVASLTTLHSRHGQHTTVVRQSHDQHLRQVCDTARHIADQRELAINNHVQVIEKEIQDLKQKLSVKLKEIEAERQESQAKLDEEKIYTEDRLAKNEEFIRYAQEERKNFIESLARIEEEKKILDNKLNVKIEEIESNMKVLEDRIETCKSWQESQMEEVRKEYDLAELIVSEHEKQTKEVDLFTNKYDKEFSEGTNAISIDMEALTKSISDIVEHNHSEMMRGVTQVQDNAQTGVSEVILSHKECSAQLQNTSNCLLQDVLDINTTTTNQLISHVETYSDTSKSRLSTISASLSNNISVSLAHTQSAQNVLDETKGDVTEHVEAVQSIINEYKKVEDKLLGEEFRMYSPTGKTPLRQQYRYPRALAATSPHERILSRYRAARNDDDVIIIESACHTPTGSDSETSRTSEHTFTEPTPRTNGHTLTKCISESDIIYSTRNGKENSEQLSGSIKKPSKLPTSQKKPLSERNMSVN